MKLAIVEKKTFLAGLQCTLTSSCAIKGAYYEVGYCGKKSFLAGLQCTLTSSCAKKTTKMNVRHLPEVCV